MNHKLRLSRLKKTIDKLEKLPDNKFDYNWYVTKSKGNCGTVCCVAGWYPKWFPESGLVWRKPYYITQILLDTNNASSVLPNLQNYHGLSEGAIRILFYGSVWKIKGGNGFISKEITENWTKEEVLFNFKHMYKLLKNHKV